MVVLAWLLLLGNAVLWQHAKTGLYAFNKVENDRTPPDAEIISQVQQFTHLSAGFFILFYTLLWSVINSLMILFRRVGRNVDRQKVTWWSVLAIVNAGYIFAIGSMEYRCYLSPLQEFSGKPLLFDIQDSQRRSAQFYLIVTRSTPKV